MEDEGRATNNTAETDAEREARYFAGYEAIPDGDDQNFKAIQQFAIESLRDSGD